jgi:hypothetical protein
MRYGKRGRFTMGSAAQKDKFNVHLLVCMQIDNGGWAAICNIDGQMSCPLVIYIYISNICIWRRRRMCIYIHK